MRTRLIVSALAASGLLAVPATAAAPQKITNEGVGKVKLGATHASLREQGLVGVLRPGCPLGGDQTRSAKLKAPLKGFVNYTTTNPREVNAIRIDGGAKAKGVGIGATIPQIKAKFPHARVNRSLEDIGLFTLVIVPRRDGGRFTFGVDTDTKKTIHIGVPDIPICE
ncbi:MAG TPA: hypothetical protein VE526_06510 [Solirubrobacteraceae bacterium]|jgi:hypothetical protein|nr:hypothetical protein [Solirubrobacteraceae bacterium]